MAIVTRGDVVVWRGAGRLRPSPFSLAWQSRLYGALSQDGWQSVRINTDAGGLQITGVCPRSYGNADWLYQQLADEANKAGWDLSEWRGTSIAQSPPIVAIPRTTVTPGTTGNWGVPAGNWDNFSTGFDWNSISRLFNQSVAGLPMYYWIGGTLLIILVSGRR